MKDIIQLKLTSKEFKKIFFNSYFSKRKAGKKEIEHKDFKLNFFEIILAFINYLDIHS